MPKPRKTALEPEAKALLKQRVEEVKELAKRRGAAATTARLLEILRTDAAGDAKPYRDLRRDVYYALSWIETDEVRALLRGALATEDDELAASIGYVLWRQDALMAELPQRVEDAVAAGDERLAGRLLAALVSGDDEGRQRAWVESRHAGLLQRIGVSYDD